MVNNKAVITKLSEFYKVFGDVTRLSILNALLDNEKNVGDICKEVNMSQSAVSHQLKILRLYNLVKYEKKGQSVFYNIADNHIKGILKYGFDHIDEFIK